MPNASQPQGATGEPRLSPRFDEALVYASQLHRDQVRKGTRIPYISHLLAVTAIVLEYGGAEDEAIAALLHDAVEDQGGTATRNAIREKFGENVASIVEGCSDANVTPKPPWKKRKDDYIAHIPCASASVRLVSAADKLHNTRAILADYQQVGEPLWERFNGGREGTLWYYRALADEFQAVESTPLTVELDRAVKELEQAAASQPGNGLAADTAPRSSAQRANPDPVTAALAQCSLVILGLHRFGKGFAGGTGTVHPPVNLRGWYDLT